MKNRPLPKRAVPLDGTRRFLHKILREIRGLRRLMTQQFDDLESYNTAMDEKTTQIGDLVTAVGVKMDRLLAQIGTGMTQAEVDHLKADGAAEVAKLTAVATTLTGLAADPEQPIP